jgi:hypothetical protein
MYKEYIETIIGTKPRARHKELNEFFIQSFANPIIHREIHGDKIYAPLDLNRIWNKTN